MLINAIKTVQYPKEKLDRVVEFSVEF